jgi:hypothetical protein
MSTITRQELRKLYKTTKDMIEKERRTREWVHRNNPPKLKEGLAECDKALEALTTVGNALAALLPAEDPVIVQEALFELPTKGRY